MSTINITTQDTDLRNVVTGRGSFLLFAEQDGKFNDRQIDLDHFYTLKQSIINTSLQVNSPPLQVATIPIGRAPFPSQPGPKDIQGTFNITAPLRFAEFYWRNLLNAKTVGAQPDSGTQDLLAATALPVAGEDLIPTLSPGDLSQPDVDPTTNISIPIRILITLAGTVADGTTVTIHGTNYFDEPIRETVTGFTSTDLDHATNNWFKSITRITSTAAGPVTIELDRYSVAPTRSGTDPNFVYDNGGRWTNLTISAGATILNGLTIAQVIGGTEGSIDTFNDCWFQQVNFRFAREEVISEEWTVVGRDGLLTVGPNGVQNANEFTTAVDARLLNAIEAEGSDTAGTGDYFRDADIRAFSGWQVCARFQNPGATPIRLAVIDGNATIASNVNFVPRVCDRAPGSAFPRTAESTIQLTLEFHQDYEPLVEAQLNAQTLENVEIEMTGLDQNGFPAQRTIHCRQLEFTEPATRTVDSDNYVSLSITGRALPSTPSATDDISVSMKVPGVTTSGAYQAWAGIMTDAADDPTAGFLRLYS